MKKQRINIVAYSEKDSDQWFSCDKKDFGQIISANNLLAKENEELKHNQNQKAIECLKEVKNYIYDDYKNCEMLRERKTLTEYGEGCFESDADYIKFINNKIKELEGKVVEE